MVSEECRLKVFESRNLRKTVGSKWDEKGNGEDSIVRNFLVRYVHLVY